MTVSDKYFGYPTPEHRGWMKYEYRVIWAHLFTHPSNEITTNTMTTHVNQTHTEKIRKNVVAHALRLFEYKGYLSSTRERREHGNNIYYYKPTLKFLVLKDMMRDIVTSSQIGCEVYEVCEDV